MGCAYFGFIDTDMVREGFAQSPTRQLRSRAPSWFTRPLPPAAAARGLERGIERRARRIIVPRALTLLLGLGFPAVLLTVTHGQNAFLTAGLLSWGLLLLPAQPVAAGVLIGALAFKPQLALLLPVALIAGGNWRAIVAASLTVLGLSAATVILFGAEIWRDFLASTALTQQMLDLGLVPYFKLQSVFAAIRGKGDEENR